MHTSRGTDLRHLRPQAHLLEVDTSRQELVEKLTQEYPVPKRVSQVDQLSPVPSDTMVGRQRLAADEPVGAVAPQHVRHGTGHRAAARHSLPFIRTQQTPARDASTAQTSWPGRLRSRAARSHTHTLVTTRTNSRLRARERKASREGSHRAGASHLSGHSQTAFLLGFCEFFFLSSLSPFTRGSSDRSASSEGCFL